MVTYTVHEPPQPAADRADRAEELRFVKDRFSWWTALFPPLGLAMRSLWLPLIIFLAAAATLAAALSWMGASANWQALAFTALSLFLGFEISTIERWMLDRTGYRILGTVTGRNIAECERRFFESWLPDQPVIRTKAEPARTRETVAWPVSPRTPGAKA